MEGGLDLADVDLICCMRSRILGAGMSRWEAALRFTGVGFFIGTSIVLGLFVGLWLDTRFNMNIFWIIGLILGLAVAFYGVFRMLIPLLDNKRDKENK